MGTLEPLVVIIIAALCVWVVETVSEHVVSYTFRLLRDTPTMLVGAVPVGILAIEFLDVYATVVVTLELKFLYPLRIWIARIPIFGVNLSMLTLPPRSVVTAFAMRALR